MFDIASDRGCKTDLLPKGNYGSACTCATTEFSSDFPGQTTKFAAQVEFLDPKQRRKLLKDHLKEYAHYHFDDNNKSNWTFDEEKEYLAQAQTAEITFLDLFRGRPFFNNRAELHSHIGTAHRNDTGLEMSTQMEMWCDELIAAHASSSHSVVETDRAFQLRKALRPFLSSSNSSSREPRLWPLVIKVRSVYSMLHAETWSVLTYTESASKVLGFWRI